MSSFFRPHRIAAIVVLIGAGAWIATGEFSAVGTAQSAGATETEQAEPAPTPAEPAAVLRTVSVIAPQFQDHTRRIRLSGVTAPDKRAVLAARSEGVVRKLDLAKGQTVAADTVVMELEGPELVAQAKIAQITLDQRAREFTVSERLFRSGNTPETQMTNARSARDAAVAALELANAAVDRLMLKAPFAGLVDSVDIELGEWVQSGAPIATVLAMDPILVRVEVSERDVDHIAPGAEARITLVTGKEMVGKVRFVAHEASAETRTFPVEIALPNPDLAVPSGMTADVELFAAPVRATTVPRSIITLAEDGTLGLRVVDKDNVASFAPVEIVDDTEAGLVVTGVPESVQVVVAGQDLVRNGDTVAIGALPAAAQAGSQP